MTKTWLSIGRGAVIGWTPLLWGWDVRNWQWWVFVLGMTFLMATKKDDL